MTNKPQFVGEKQPLENRVDYVRGVTYKAAVDLHEELNDSSYVLLRANNIQDGELRFDDVQYVDRAKVKQKQLLRRGDILFCASSGSKGLVGKAALVRENMPVTFGAFCCVLRPKENEAEYLAHYFQSQQYRRAIEKACSGSNINNLKAANFFSLVVPHYDDDSTRVISALFDSIDAQIKHAKDQIANLDSLVKSRFIEMFGDLDSDDSRPLKDVCSIITDGTHQPPKFVDEGIPFLFVSNIASDVVDYETNKFISAEDYEQLIRRTPIEIGDVLVSAVGSFGHPAIVRDGRPFCFQRHIAYLKPRHNLVDSDYLHAALLSDDAQRYMDRCAKGVAQRTVTLKSFKEMKIPVPSMCLQEEFAAFVSQVDKSRFVDLGDKGNKCILILEIRKEDLGRTYNFGVEILHCYTDRVGLKRMAEGRKRNNPLQVIASNLLARPDNHTASATNQSVRFNYGAAPDFASTS